jgi:hypothetical protein
MNAIVKHQRHRPPITGLGEEPMGLAAVGIQHTGIIGCAGLFGTLVGWSIGGPAIAAWWAGMCLNDFFYAARQEKGQPTPLALPEPEDETPDPAPTQAWQPPVPQGWEPYRAPMPAQVPTIAPQASATQVVEWKPKEFNLVTEIAENLSSMLIIGSPGAGKGMLMANAVREVAKCHPEIKLVGLDTKGDPKETGYWNSFHTVHRINHLAMPSQDLLAWFQERMEEIRDTDGPTLFVLDEWNAVIQRIKNISPQVARDFSSQVTGISSSGQSRRLYLWGMGQTPQASSLAVDGGTRCVFKPIAIVDGRQMAMVEQFLRTSFVPNPPGGLAEIQSICQQSPVQRAVFWNDQWYPMPSLPNHSGYDRDTLTHMAPASPAIIPAHMPQKSALEQTIENLGALDDKVLAQLMIEFLRWIQKMGDGCELSTSLICLSPWAISWARGDGGRPIMFKNRSAKTITPILETIARMTGFIEKRGEKTWIVNLKGRVSGNR